MEQPQTGVRSVQLALDILETIAFSGEQLGVTQLAQRLSTAKGSIHRHLVTLVDQGYLEQNAATNRYGVGPKARLLGRLAPQADLIQLAEGPMWDLRDALGHTVVLSAMTPRGALVLATLASASAIEIGVRPGTELSFSSSAQGKALLAFAPPQFQQRVLSQPLEKLTSKTVVDRERLQDEIKRIVRLGYAAAPEQSLLGVNAVAAPVFGESGSCVGAVAIVGSIQFLPERSDPEDVQRLKQTATQISRKLGHKQAPPPIPHRAPRGIAR